MHKLFSERLRKFRIERNLSASEVARQIGVAQSTYSDWENGKGLRLPPFQKISQVLAISVTELVTGQRMPATELIGEIRNIESKLAELRAKIGSVS